MRNTSNQQVFLEILDHLKIPYQFVGGGHQPNRENVWDGVSFRFGEHEFEHKISHELAHWLVATPEQRKMREFGLGCAPDFTLDITSSLKMNSTEAVVIEEHASFLGLAMLRSLGMPYEAELEDQGWEESEFQERLDEMVDADGNPEVVIETAHLRK